MNFWGSNISWLLLVITIFVDFIFPFVLSLFYHGYNNMNHVISLLGNPKSPVANIFKIWMISMGILFCISAINFYIVYYPISHLLSSIGTVMLLTFGISTCVIGGIFSLDEEKKLNTVSSLIHGIGAGIGFLALSFVPLILSLISFKSNNTTTGVISIVCFVLSILFVILFILSEKYFFKKPIVCFNGLWQRLLLISSYIPLLLIAINFL